MASSDKRLPQGVIIVDGAIYDDGWITPRLGLVVSAECDAAEVRITLWNPDFSAMCMENAVSVTVDGDASTQEGIALGQILEIRIDARTHRPLSLQLDIRNTPPQTEIDPRSRAMVLHSFSTTTHAERAHPEPLDHQPET